MCWIYDVFMSIILCGLVLPATKSLDNEGYVYLLATAMYMADSEGKYVLLDETLPPSIEAIIKEHALSLLNPSERSKTIIKVVPKPHHWQPFDPSSNIVRVDLREMTSRKHFMSGVFDSLKNFWDNKIMHRGTNNKKKTKQIARTLKTPIQKSGANDSDNVMGAGDDTYTTVRSTITDGTQTSVTERADENTAAVTDTGDKVTVLAIKGVQLVNTIGETKDSEDTWLVNPKPTSDGKDQPSRQNEYVPSDIYYSIEKKCANWSDGC